MTTPRIVVNNELGGLCPCAGLDCSATSEYAAVGAVKRQDGWPCHHLGCLGRWMRGE
jgi:hypothetical protein